MAKNRPIVRKPDSQNSGLSSYKTIKRKSQEKGNHFDATPPKYPRSSQEIKQSVPSEEAFLRTSSKEEKEDIVKFKKKPLTKEEIIEIKYYVEGLDKAESEVNSVAGTERPTVNRDIEAPLPKELTKKSKTQYFHIEEFQRYPPLDGAESEVPPAPPRPSRRRTASSSPRSSRSASRSTRTTPSCRSASAG